MSAADSHRIHVERTQWLADLVEEAVRRASPPMSAQAILGYILDQSNLPRARARAILQQLKP